MPEKVVTELVSKWGYFGIFGGMFLEGLAIPFPGAIFILLAGAFALKMKLSVGWIVFYAVLGYSLGTLLPYYIARRGGRQVLYKYGRYLSITPRVIKTAEHWFAKYGSLVVCLSRPFFFGNYISYLAGLAKMRFDLFIMYTLLGVLPWCVALCVAGYYAGQAGLLLIRQYSWYAVLLIVPATVLLYVGKNILGKYADRAKLFVNLQQKEGQILSAPHVHQGLHNSQDDRGDKSSGKSDAETAEKHGSKLEHQGIDYKDKEPEGQKGQGQG